MENIRIVIADPDEKYIGPLERKFIDEFGEHGEIIVITDPEYLRQFFETPQSIDILMINKELYNKNMERHEITNIYILSEGLIDEEHTGNLDINTIYKYTSVKEIFNEVINNSSMRSTSNISSGKETKIILVYSPIGGIGKTTVAIGLCAALTKKHKKVLFVGTDNLQTFGYFMKNKITLKGNIEKQFATNDENMYSTIRNMIEVDTFCILPPFARALSSLNITGDNFVHLLELAKKSIEYDFIVVDSSTDFSEDIAKLMSISDSTLILTGQDLNSGNKLECLLNNIDCSDTNRFAFACNKYRANLENILVSEPFINKIRICEYLNYEDAIVSMSCKEIGNIKSFQKLAFRYI